MTELTSEEMQELVDFVREGLGCGCPDEVFSSIHIEKNPDDFCDLPIDYRNRSRVSGFSVQGLGCATCNIDRMTTESPLIACGSDARSLKRTSR